MVRLNLLLNNPGGVRSGYLNVDPYSQGWAAAADPGDLGGLCDANEAAELVALEVLDFYPAHLADAALDHWLSRLAHGGEVTLSTVDLREVCRGFLGGYLSHDDANNLLHGIPTHDAGVKRSSYTLGQLVEVLENKGMVVVRKRLQNYRAVVTARRP